MLIQLPLEVWMEILDWLRGHRRELAEMCNQLGDRTFVEICQHWLHDYTKNVQLGILHIEVEKIINKGRPEKRGCLKVDIDFEQFKVPFAQVPMPANITGFLALEISYLDSMVLDFLRLMPFWTNYNSKIRLNIELWDDENEWMLRTALGHFQRLLSSGIEAVLFNERTTLIFPSILQQFPDLLFSAKLLVLDQRIITYSDEDRQLVRWLGTERADGKPRMAVLYNTSTSVTADLIHDIREQFPNDTAPTSFFAALYSYSQLDGIPEESNNENVTTGEQLIVRKRECLHNLHVLLIGRCPVNLNGNRWLQEMEQKAAMPEECFGSWRAIYEYDSPPTMLVTLNPLLIGPIQSEVEEYWNDDNNPQDQQPGPSGLT